MATAKIGQDLLQLVSFTIGEEEYGVDILRVQEIIRMVQVTRVPNMPPYVEGVINLRGKIIPIVDLRTRLGMEPKKHDQYTRTIVMELDSKVVGFVVDAVSEVLRIDKSKTEPPPAIVGGNKGDFIKAIGRLDDRLLTLLDLEKVIVEDVDLTIAA